MKLSLLFANYKLQLNLFEVTIHSGDMDIAIDRWLLIAQGAFCATFIQQ